MSREWSVRFSSEAEKQYKKLKRSGTRPCITDVIDLLVIELQKSGPIRADWPNYGKLSTGYYHCHLKKGRPTFVACWTVVSEKQKQIEVFYVGTHENSPY
jgi:mRNA-degrading endonuclease RelE of RelBE toxin-antitoxin system